MMEWLTQNAFQLLALAASIGSGVWAASRMYYTLDNRISALEKEMARLDEKLDKDIQELRMCLVELRGDIKHLTEIILKSKD